MFKDSLLTSLIHRVKNSLLLLPLLTQSSFQTPSTSPRTRRRQHLQFIHKGPQFPLLRFQDRCYDLQQVKRHSYYALN